MLPLPPERQPSVRRTRSMACEDRVADLSLWNEVQRLADAAENEVDQEMKAIMNADVYCTPDFRPVGAPDGIKGEQRDPDFLARLRVVGPPANDRPPADIYGAWKQDTYPPLAEREALRRVDQETLNEWQETYNTARNNNGTLPPSDPLSAEYRVRDKLASDSSVVHEDILKSMGMSHADLNAIARLKDPTQAFMQRAKDKLEEEAAELERLRARRRVAQGQTGVPLSQAVSVIDEMVDMLVRTKLAGSSQLTEPSLPPCTDAGIPPDAADRLEDLETNLMNTSTEPPLNQTMGPRTADGRSNTVGGGRDTPVDGRSGPSPAGTPVAGSSSSRGQRAALDGSVDGGRVLAQRIAAGKVQDGVGFVPPWMVENVAGEGGVATDQFPDAVLPRPPGTGAAMAVFSDNKSEWQQRATAAMLSPEPGMGGWTNMAQLGEESDDRRPHAAVVDPSTDALRPKEMNGKHRMPQTGKPNPARAPGVENDAWTRNEEWVKNLDAAWERLLSEEQRLKAQNPQLTAQDFLDWAKGWITAPDGDPSGFDLIAWQLHRGRFKQDDIPRPSDGKPTGGLSAATSQAKRRRSSRAAAGAISTGAWAHSSGWDLRTLPYDDAGERGTLRDHASRSDAAYKIMNELIAESIEAVVDNRYFAHNWKREKLLELEDYLPTVHQDPDYTTRANYDPVWTDFKDEYMAKFFIYTNLLCLDLIGKQTAGGVVGTSRTDFRTRMTSCFDLPSLLDNVKKIWRYRKNVWRAKSRTMVGGTLFDNGYSPDAMRTIGETMVTTGNPATAEASAYDKDGRDEYTPRAIYQEEHNRQVRFRFTYWGMNNPGWTDGLDYAPPPELPVLLLAPPRMGKSALIWLMTSFGVKLGGTVFLGLAPHKKIPMDEMLGKAQGQLQWTRLTAKELQVLNKKTRSGTDVGAPSAAQRPPTPAQQGQVELTAIENWAVRQEASSNGGVFATRLAPRGAAASNVTGKPRKTQQGLEVAVPWTIQDIPQDPNNPDGLKHEEEAIWRRIGINGAYYSPEQNREGTWTEASLSSVETVATKAYASKMQRLDNWWPNQVGTTYKMMRSGADHARTHVFMYSHHTTDDALAAEKAIDILRSPDLTRWEEEAGFRSEERLDEWVLHIRDEAQYLCQSAIDAQKFPELSITCPWIFEPGYGGSGREPKNIPIDPRGESGPHDVQENGDGGNYYDVGWRRPGRILNALRSTYPIMKGLSVCVSGTVMPCMIETQLWGNVNLPEMDTSASGAEAFPPIEDPGGNPAVVVNAWKQWYGKWDTKLTDRTSESYLPSNVFKNPRLSSALCPPKGRIARIDEFPEWVRNGDPNITESSYDSVGNPAPSGTVAAGRFYYGTMNHVKPWDGGALCLRYDTPGIRDILNAGLRGPEQYLGDGTRVVFKPDDPDYFRPQMQGWGCGPPTTQGEGVYGRLPSPSVFPLLNDDVQGRSGIGKFLSFSMNKLDMALDYSEAELRKTMTELTADYQNDWQVRDRNGKLYAFPGRALHLATASGEPEKVRERAAEIIKRVRANNKQLLTKGTMGPGWGAADEQRLKDYRFEYYRGRHYYRVPRSRAEQLQLQAAYGPAIPLQPMKLFPYRRIMASVIEFPSSDAIKVFTHVKEWLEEDATEVPADPQDQSVIDNVFSPMYVMCPLRRQQGDAGVADWVKHAIKFAWLRMHKDFIQHKAPIRFEIPARIRAVAAVRKQLLADPVGPSSSPELDAAERALKAAEDAKEKHRMYYKKQTGGVPDGDPMHPYNSCETIIDFRRKYGIVVLLYASDQSEEQNMRTSLQNDMEGWELEQELQSARATGVTSQTESTGKGTETNKDGRLLSVLFDPALVENRLASYGEPPTEWTVIERRQRDLEPYLPPIEAEVDAVADAPAVRTVPLGRERQPLEQAQQNLAGATYTQLRDAAWVPYGTPVGAGRMIPVAHGFRMENNLLIDEARTAASQGQSVFLRPPSRDPADKEPRFRVQQQSEWIPDYDGMRGLNIQSETELPAVRNPKYQANVHTTQYYYSEFAFDTTLQPDEMPRLKYRRAGPGEWKNESAGYGARSYTQRDGYLNPEPTTLEDLNGIVVRHRMDYWPNAQDATKYFLEKFGIHKTMIAGYGMLEAGLTIQSTVKGQHTWFPANIYRVDGMMKRAGVGGVGGLDLHWVPKYMSIATSEQGPVDAHYQIIGRCFVDMRDMPLPDGWRINFLAARPIHTMIKIYSLLELRLAHLENVTLTHAFAHLAQMMTHPDLVQDDGTRDVVHDAVSHLLHHKMHTKAREGGRIHKVLGLALGPSDATGGIGEWKITLPQHAPRNNDTDVVDGKMESHRS